MTYDEKYAQHVDRVAGAGLEFDNELRDNACVASALSLHRIAVALEKIAGVMERLEREA